MNITVACPLCGTPLRCTVMESADWYGGGRYVSHATGCSCFITTAAWQKIESEALLHAAAILAAVH